MGWPALTRRRIIVEETPIEGMEKNRARAPPGRALSAAAARARGVPRRFAIAGAASASTRSGACQ